MHMNLPPICLARLVCCACAREENSAAEDALTAIRRDIATTRRLIMPFPKSYRGCQCLRGGLLRPGSLRRASPDQNRAAVRQKRNQTTQDNDQAAKPNPLHERI